MRILATASFLALASALLPASAARAESVTLAPVTLTEWKAVYGRIEARDRIPARARLGGTLASLRVAEGDTVEQGDVLAEIVDQKIGFQLSALTAQRQALAAQLDNAQAELTRGEELLKQGVTTAQRLDALRTQVDVVTGQIAALDAQRQVVEQQAAEGAVLAPVSGRILDVPVAQGAVVLPGEPVAMLGGGGIFLRLAIPERHAADLTTGATIRIDGAGGPTEGTLIRIYPLIENGRVIADVEVQGLPDDFVDARILVRLPVGDRQALAVPETALVTRAGLDFVAIDGAGLRAVVPGTHEVIDGQPMVEILSGLRAGDRILTQAPEAPAAEEASHD
ncbi:efflux RND transporter periplasmic adaptor subunit [Rhodobacteraceae bacterium HSP-20]|uniref:Efflux RND transporter periplasmic adaptor subunit n=1 Tax=Paragemmobacter amnigenus TaxID=2852097 RepID=A0ABS6JAW5_9RHOB|nr:efflux RND transporter periplasmic adaptor subunit [Rhodobacter amnigenus]MBU9699627.1 efflux RND transporter periplasmic adaptor subunit [Rhodobacter amnigenus]MBV4390854.1 efflux RND transporter periplasmic adaptor subunit [Rhodobacter amnigenus]